jgi:hypothetical protein
MSTFISEPGTRLAGRYRLEDRVSDTAGSTLWKAIDETLARPVAVLTFAPGFPRVQHVVTAARAASRMTDSRLAQVFDVEDVGDRAYVVLEWVSGESLDDLLASGPLEPARAAALIGEAAQALAAAHATGLAHLCLTPRSLRWTPGGGIKITGLGVEAAMYGAHAENPSIADTQGLGRLLYAALTAHWPGEDSVYLPPAPYVDGELCTPRQVRAGVPAGIDAVCTLAISGRPGRGRAALSSPAALADELSHVAPAAPLTPPPLPIHSPTGRGGSGRGAAGRSATGHSATGRSATGHLSGPSTSPHSPANTEAMRDGGLRRPPPRRGVGGIGKALVGVVIILVVAAIGFGAWTLSRNLGGPARAGGATSARPSTSAVAVLTPLSAHGFDVYDTTGQDGNENDSQAPLAIDGNPQTAWHTLFYENNPRFGGLKKGTGLILDMAKPVRLSTVEVLFGPTAGADVQIEVGNNGTLSPGSLSAFTTVARANDVPGGDYTFHATGTAAGRYVLIWFTKLPPQPQSQRNFEAEIFNINVRGTS